MNLHQRRLADGVRAICAEGLTVVRVVVSGDCFTKSARLFHEAVGGCFHLRCLEAEQGACSGIHAVLVRRAVGSTPSRPS